MSLKHAIIDSYEVDSCRNCSLRSGWELELPVTNVVLPISMQPVGFAYKFYEPCSASD